VFKRLIEILDFTNETLFFKGRGMDGEGEGKREK